MRSRIIHELHVLSQIDRLIVVTYDIPGRRIKKSRRMPVSKLHLRAWRKKKRKFPTLRPQPEPVLAAIGVHMCVDRPVKRLIMHPAKTDPIITTSRRRKY